MPVSMNAKRPLVKGKRTEILCVSVCACIACKAVIFMSLAAEDYVAAGSLQQHDKG